MENTELGRFVGRYRLGGAVAGGSPALEVNVEWDADRLAIHLPGSGPRLLVPIAPTRFRILRPDGSPTGHLDFGLGGGRVERATVELGDTVVLRCVSAG
jgi:hypothetical protein